MSSDRLQGVLLEYLFALFRALLTVHTLSSFALAISIAKYIAHNQCDILKQIIYIILYTLHHHGTVAHSGNTKTFKRLQIF